MWTLPGATAFIAGSNLAPMIVHRIRPALVVGASLALTAVGIGLVSQPARTPWRSS
jgi:DHA2 family multidrug resistance protein-like MFS transporter